MLDIINDENIEKQTVHKGTIGGIVRLSCNATPGVRQNITPKNVQILEVNGIYNNVFDEIFTLVR